MRRDLQPCAETSRYTLKTSTEEDQRIEATELYYIPMSVAYAVFELFQCALGVVFALTFTRRYVTLSGSAVFFVFFVYNCTKNCAPRRSVEQLYTTAFSRMACPTRDSDAT